MPALEYELEHLRSALVSSAYIALTRQSVDGWMPAGHNGPYLHKETPARNTAHWCVTFSKLWELTGDPRFQAAGRRAAMALVEALAENNGGPLVCRTAVGRDATNGVIGQAWVVEGLVEAATCLDMPEALNSANTLFGRHLYDDKLGGWRCAALNGRPGPLDWTFNHQLWMCAIGASLMSAGEQAHSSEVRHFASKINSRMTTYSDGLIRHANHRFLTSGPLKLRPTALARGLTYGLQAKRMRLKSLGYHGFNTYALAMIARVQPTIAPDTSKGPSKAAIRFLTAANSGASVAASPYGFPYNPPGWEAAYSLLAFRPTETDSIAEWLRRQREETFDDASGEFTRSACDVETARARIYEASRLI